MGTRHIGVAVDYSESSKYALKWTIDNIMKAGDHLILIVVNKSFLDDSQFHLWEQSGSREYSTATVELQSFCHYFLLKRWIRLLLKNLIGGCCLQIVE